MTRASRGIRRVRGLAVLAAIALVAAGCAGTAPEPSTDPLPSVPGVDVVEKGLVYESVGGVDMALDAYIPADDGTARPAVLLLHGGGFVSGQRDTGGMLRIAQEFVKRGYAAFSMSYRLAPQNVYPAQTEDVTAAAAWLSAPEQVERFHIDPARMAIFGSSAGATIALRAAADPVTQTGFRAVVALSGASMLGAGALALGNPSGDEVKAVLAYLGCAEVKSCTNGDAASAALHVTAESSPAFLAGSTDEIVPIGQSQAMADALTAAGVSAALVVVPGAAHAAELLSGDLWQQIDAFLRAQLALS